VTGNPPAFPYQDNPYLTGLIGGGSCADAGASHAVCYARVSVPWDAVNNGRGSFAAGTCAPSPSGPGTAAAAFSAEVTAAARMVGVDHVMVALSAASDPHDDIWPTDHEYECGFSGLERAAPGVTQWEVFNEPDSISWLGPAAAGVAECTHRNGALVTANGQAQCLFGSPAANPHGGNGHGGSAQGAAYWYLDAKRVDHNPTHTLLAGGFNYSSSRCTPSTCYYLAGYMRVLARIYPHGPDAVALHPYLDVNYAALNGGNPVPPASSGLASGQGAIAVIDRFFPKAPPVWFTEVGVWLTDVGREPVTSGCADGNPQDDGAWSGCLNANPTAQALAAEGYLRLPSESPQVKRVYYYDFNGQNPGWDSGLINMQKPLLGSRGYGTPRTTWCVLHAYALGDSPVAAATAALRPGSNCDAPVVDAAYLSDPLPAPAAAAAATPGDVSRDLLLSVAERVRALVASL
jgi:hypothetical protein